MHKNSFDEEKDVCFTTGTSEDTINPIQDGADFVVSPFASSEPDIAKDPKSFLEAPYSFSMANSESISLNNGGLQITVTDFVLPGRNGFDLSITRRYNSDNANLLEWGPLYWGTWGQGGFSTESRPNEHNLRTYGLGYGWSFMLPSIEAVPQRLRHNRITYYPFLHLENGQTFTMVDDDNRLDDHPQRDVSVQAFSGTIRHPFRSDVAKDYTTIVSYKNGNKDYFEKIYSASGLEGYNLVARADVFGNIMCFSFSGYGGMQIVDTWGRDINLVKSGNNLTWTLPDGKQVVYSFEDLGGRKLMRARDQVGRFTKYDYYDPEIYKGRVKFATESWGDYSQVGVPFMLLKSFTHPTGAVTAYEYGTSRGDTPTPLTYTVGELGGYRESYPVRLRMDSYGGTNYNEGLYSYVLSADKNYVASASVSLLEGVTEQHTFNDKSRLTRKEIKHSGALVFTGEHEYGTDSQAANYKLSTYEDALNTIITTDENGWRTKYCYTPLGQIQQVYLTGKDLLDIHNVLQQQYEYDRLERLTCEKTFNTDGSVRCTTNYQYDAFGRVLQKRIEETGYQENHVYTDAATAPYFNVTCKLHQKNVLADNSALNISTQTYTDANDNTVVECLGDVYTARYQYDKLGNKVNCADAKGNTTFYIYNWAGQETSTSRTTGGQSYSNKIYYDYLGNKFSEYDFTKYPTMQYYYDSAGRLLRQVGAFDDKRLAETQYRYDAAGNLVLQRVKTNDGWRETEYTYDARGRQTQATQRGANQTDWNRTEYDYDAAGNRLAVRTGITFYSYQRIMANTPTCHTTKYTYDRYGNVLSMVDPLGQTERYDYDVFGLLQTKTDRGGAITTYTYDAQNRLVAQQAEVRHESKSLISRYTCAYNRAGQKTSETRQDTQNGTPGELIETRYSYNAKGQLYTQSERQGVYKSFAYDACGNRSFMEVQLGRETPLKLWYTYDELNRLTQVWQTQPQTIPPGQTPPVGLLAVYGYDANGNRTSLRYPQTGLETTYEYNYAYLVTRLTNWQGPRTRNEFTYTYGVDGNQLSKQDDEGLTTYRYDDYGRLIEEDYPGWQTIQYEYDAYHNRSKMKVSYPPSRPQAGYTTTYTYDDNNRLLQEVKAAKKTTETTTYKYDASGNETRKEWEKTEHRAPGTKPPHMGFAHGKPRTTVLSTRRYNGFGQLISLWKDATLLNYTYRPDNLRQQHHRAHQRNPRHNHPAPLGRPKHDTGNRERPRKGQICARRKPDCSGN